jgi:hypothetical protein
VRQAVTIHMVSAGSQQGWVHTHGMDQLGLPELEVRHVPQFLMRPTAELLWAVAEYMLQGERPVRVGEHMQVSGYGILTFRAAHPIPGHEDHYLVERWILTDEESETCPECAGARTRASPPRSN